MNVKSTHDAQHLRGLNALLEVALSLRETERAGDQPARATLRPMRGRGVLETDAFLRWPADHVLYGSMRGSEPRTGDELGAYRGCWYWDGALIAALFDVDPSRLRDEGNYPADLEVHARRQNNRSRSGG